MPGWKSCGGEPVLVTATLTPLDFDDKGNCRPRAVRATLRTVPGRTMPSSWKVLLPSVARWATASFAVLKNTIAEVRPLNRRKPMAATITTPTTSSRLR